ncbi:MAG: cupin domain-containing protein, partial [Lentisphaerae bacterium]|nr:cupin domain-containing protein [Lentisphaerota bacterium]
MRIMSKLYSWKKYFTEEDLPFQAMIHRQIYQVIHHHEFLELVIVLNGKGTHYFAGREYPIAAGDAFVIKEGIDHDYRNPENLIIANVRKRPAGYIFSRNEPCAKLPLNPEPGTGGIYDRQGNASILDQS